MPCATVTAVAAPVSPLGDRIIVVVLPRERVTAGGVLLPENIREESDRGVIVGVGPGTWIDDGGAGAMRPIGYPDPLECGQVVLFSPYAGSTITMGADSFLLIREHDLLGVVVGADVPSEIAERYQLAAA